MFKTRKKTDAIIVHCSATQAKTDVGAAEIERWHRERGFLAIGYHYVIRRDGRIEKGRDETVVGAHVEGHNSTTVGVCMVGGIDAKGNPQDNFTPAQYASLQTLLRELKTRYSTAEIKGHRDFPGVAKACPSFSVKGWLTKNPL